MNRASHSVAILCLIPMLILSSIPRPALAQGEGLNFSRPRRVLAVPLIVKPIGMIESLGTMKINGRMISGKEFVWSDDLLEAPGSATAQVTLDSIGQIILAGGTLVRFKTIGRELDHRAGPPTLIASLITGHISVKLRPQTTAYFKARDLTFAASDGASFRLGLREEQAFVETSGGTVAGLGNWGIHLPPPIHLAISRARRVQAQATQRRLVIRPVGGQAVFDVRARATRQIQIQVTDENDRPVPDVPIIFALGSGVGQLSSTTAATNAQGIATVNFTAGDQPSSTSITATIEGTNISWTGQLVILKAVAGFWSWQNAGPVFATAAAAAAGAVVAITNRESKKINPDGPPTIRP